MSGVRKFEWRRSIARLARAGARKGTALQSYSEMPGIAPFHTDASYYPVPMKYLLFFVIRPAEIGGETQIFNLASKIV